MSSDECRDPESVKKRLTIAELEALLNRDDDIELEILPNGEVRAGQAGSVKPVTFRESLGGEYAEASR